LDRIAWGWILVAPLLGLAGAGVDRVFPAGPEPAAARPERPAPAIAQDRTNAWAAFEYDASSVTGIKVGIIDDAPEPFGEFTAIGTTDYSGSIDVRVHAEQGFLWVTWLDGSEEVGWSVYDDGSEIWSSPDYESYALDDLASARERIQEAIVGQ